MKWPQNSVSISKIRMNTILEKLISDISRFAFVVSATLLVACNSGSVSTDSSGQPAASSPSTAALVRSFSRAMSAMTAPPDMSDIIALESGEFNVNLISSE